LKRRKTWTGYGNSKELFAQQYQSSMKVELPQASKAGETSRDVIITINAQGQVSLENTKMDPGTLKYKLSAMVKNKPDEIKRGPFALERERSAIPMKGKPILIADDEKNIRLTLSLALEALGVEIETVENGEDALAKLKEKDFGLILLDLHMPGVDGMEVLRQVREIRPEIQIIIITAYGTVDRAVEALKLGAVDFIQKPFVPEEIREVVARVIDREKLDEQKVTDYGSSIELAKKSIADRHFDAAVEHIRHAISLGPGRPEAFNLLGAAMEIQGDRIEAQKNYRAALSLDPSYKPAISNLERSTEASWKRKGRIELGKDS
jgi:DNA-binding response OmpR family regulator